MLKDSALVRASCKLVERSICALPRGLRSPECTGYDRSAPFDAGLHTMVVGTHTA